MNKFKRFYTILLSAILIFSFSTATFAQSDSNTSVENNVIIEYVSIDEISEEDAAMINESREAALRNRSLTGLFLTSTNDHYFYIGCLGTGSDILFIEGQAWVMNKFYDTIDLEFSMTRWSGDVDFNYAKVYYSDWYHAKILGAYGHSTTPGNSGYFTPVWLLWTMYNYDNAPYA